MSPILLRYFELWKKPPIRLLQGAPGRDHVAANLRQSSQGFKSEDPAQSEDPPLDDLGPDDPRRLLAVTAKLRRELDVFMTEYDTLEPDGLGLVSRLNILFLSVPCKW